MARSWRGLWFWLTGGHLPIVCSLLSACVCVGGGGGMEREREILFISLSGIRTPPFIGD
jgi:hypothetical protein